MSLLIVGVSYRTAPVEVLERLSIPAAEIAPVLRRTIGSEWIDEAMVVSTCNRVEVYAEASRFHSGLAEITSMLAERAGITLAELGEYLYVHYEDAVVAHAFRVAAGLDSLVPGEAQILGQVRQAYTAAVAAGTAGRVIHELAQKALQAAKRARATTGLDRAGASVVGVALDRAGETIDLASAHAVVVGAGSMGALAATSLRRAGVDRLTLVNRTEARARRRAHELAAEVASYDDIEGVIADADLVVACTAASRYVLRADQIARAVSGRVDRPLLVLDLAMPRNVDPESRYLPGVACIDLDALADHGGSSTATLETARTLVDSDVAAFLSAQRAVQVTPTITALRNRAQEVVEAELARLDARLPGLDEAVRDELAKALRRTVSTLLHKPTVRAKELAEAPGGDSYAEALRELFQLELAGIGPAAVTKSVEPASGGAA
ncbi:MAG: glutamyl-tRNA reductase [Mycobacteriales bacterium]